MARLEATLKTLLKTTCKGEEVYLIELNMDSTVITNDETHQDPSIQELLQEFETLF